MFVFGIAAAAAASWVATPFVAMHRRGTLAQQQHKAIRAEVRLLKATRDKRERTAAPANESVVIPAPRGASEPIGVTRAVPVERVAG